MASCFQTWTVLPHQPIEKLAPNLWAVRGTMDDPRAELRSALDVL